MGNMHDNVQTIAAKLVQKAKDANCWIFCMATKEWHTPEEFEQLAAALIISCGTNTDLFIHFNLRDPKDGIRIRTAYLKKASKELEEFTERVMTYAHFIDKTVRNR